jgi:hypothetical protein
MTRLRVITPLLLVAGLALMVPFEGPVAHVPGVACLLGFIACGVFLIAEPAFLAGEARVGSAREEDER